MGESAARYTIISADTHAGGSHSAYREYLDPRYREEFDAWRARYRNPYRDLEPSDNRRLRNWDDELRNNAQDEDGVVGEVIFPNTVPPFFPSFVLAAPPPTPETYELRLAGIRAHNRWLVDFCASFPERRAGIGQVFLNDIDDALEDVRFIKEHGLRGGMLLQPVPPDAQGYIRPLNHPDYDRLWALCEDLEVPINAHGGTGCPTYPDLLSSAIINYHEIPFYSKRSLAWLILAGVFERFPRLRFVLTEQGCAWLPTFAAQLDLAISRVQSGRQGELRFAEGMAPPRLASEYIHDNLWLGVSFPARADVEARTALAPGHWMWGSDFPHDEGTYPFTREHIRQVFEGVSVEEKRALLGGNAAALYDFDLNRLAPLTAAHGPLVEDLEVPLDGLPDEANSALRKGLEVPVLRV